MPTLSEALEAHADDWTEWARRRGHDSYWRFHRTAFLELVPAPGALTLDVGCGEGRVARDLAALGHRVLALDAAPTMVRRTAEAGGGLLGAVQADAARLPLPDGAAGLVIAFMALHDMDDMAGAVHEFARVLRRGGRLCLAVIHPLNGAGSFGDERDAEFVVTDDYFWRRRRSFHAEGGGLRMTFGFMHRPLEDYFAAMMEAGLAVEMVREPRPGDGSAWDRIPPFLGLRAVRV